MRTTIIASDSAADRGPAQHGTPEKIQKPPGEDGGRLGDDVDLGPQHDGEGRNMDCRQDGGEPPFNGRREANTISQEGDSGWHRRLSRDSPDDSRTGVNSSAFRASAVPPASRRAPPASGGLSSSPPT